MSKETATMRIEQVRSAIGCNPKQREILRTLGLRRMNSVVERLDNQATRGAIAKVSHLVRVLEEE